MDYEKKYKEALELARVAAFNGHQSLMEGIFPELKESEDEGIRKEIIYHIKNCDDTINEETEKRMLAWLENIPYTIDHEKREGFHLGYKTALEKQGETSPILSNSSNIGKGEQKPAWSEKDKKEYKYVLKFVDNVLNNCGNKKDYEHCKRCYDWLKSLKDRYAWKPSDKQMNALWDKISNDNLPNSEKEISQQVALTELYEQLKILKGE